MSAGPPVAMVPRARSRELIIRRFGDETVVYDRTTHRAHCLNGTASFVFDRCDGGTPPEALARQLRRELEDPAEAMIAGFVDMALEQLEGAGLLENVPAPGERDLAARRSRRETLRKLSTAAALPAVLSALVPTPVEAQTCVPRNGSCTSSQQCCPDAPCCRPLGGRPPRCTPGGGNCLP